MNHSVRRGWWYSLFAGVVACLVAISFVSVDYLPQPTLFVVAMTVAAMVSARLGGWLALLSGGRDHGWRAAAYTCLLYLIFCGTAGGIAIILSEVPAEDAWAHLLRGGVLDVAGRLAEGMIAGSLSAMFFGWWVIALPCAIGTLLFQALLRALGKAGPDQPLEGAPPTSA